MIEIFFEPGSKIEDAADMAAGVFKATQEGRTIRVTVERVVKCDCGGYCTKYGKPRGKQRYICKKCHRIFMGVSDESP